MCDIKSPLSAKPPIFTDDYYKLNELCLRSFCLAYGDIKPKVIFICDNCPEEKYRELLKTVPFEHEIMFTNLGINDSCLLQYELAKAETDDVILFAECDQLWVPLIGNKVENAIKHFGLFSGYDHPDFYSRYDIHPKNCEVQLFEDHHYRTAARNVMTFGITREAFNKNFDILKRWGYLDNDVWREMRDNGYPLWTALPALWTHMVKGFLSPGLDWKKLWETLAPELKR